MSLVWLEALLPLGIIGGMLCVMGNAQYYIHRAAHGRVRGNNFFLVFVFNLVVLIFLLLLNQPKHVGNDEWDVAMERRDKKLMEKVAAAQD